MFKMCTEKYADVHNALPTTNIYAKSNDCVMIKLFTNILFKVNKGLHQHDDFLSFFQLLTDKVSCHKIINMNYS